MSFRFDEDIVLAKASSIRKCVAAIRQLAVPENGALQEWVRQDVTVLNLQRAVEALQDLANHLASANGWELPRDSRHAFTVLGEHGLLDAPGVALAHAMVGFRNIAVHDYAALNPDVVRAIARDRLGDIETLVNGLLVRLRPAPDALAT